jgi:hypothetical protein
MSVDTRRKRMTLFQMTVSAGLQVCELFWNGVVKRMGAESGCIITVAFWVGVGRAVREKLRGWLSRRKFFKCA